MSVATIRRIAGYPARPLLRRIRRWLRSRALRSQIAGLSGGSVRVIVGSGGIGQQGWVSTDIDDLNLLDRTTWTRYFSPSSIDALLAEHVWEHLTAHDASAAARVCYEFLKPGAYLRIAVPDGLNPDPKYIDYVRPGGHGAGADDHKVLYTFETLRAVFSDVGFAVTLLEYFDRDGHFHRGDWDPAAGLIARSACHDERNREKPLSYTSLILDAKKPQNP
jgi:predicted SAM-dependent methyltransferase